MQSLKSPYTLYNQQSVGSTLHNNLLFISSSSLLITDTYDFAHNLPPILGIFLVSLKYASKTLRFMRVIFPTL